MTMLTRKEALVRQSQQADHERMVTGMAHPLLGKYVNIEWYAGPKSGRGGLCGTLIEITQDPEGIWLVCDWGYAVLARYVTKIHETEKTEETEDDAGY